MMAKKLDLFILVITASAGMTKMNRNEQAGIKKTGSSRLCTSTRDATASEVREDLAAELLKFLLGDEGFLP